MSALHPLPLRRALAVFLAGLYVVGAFSGIVHVAAVEHTRCAEHGEIVHLDDALRADVRVGYYEEERLHAGERGAHHAEHDHCLVLAPSSPVIATLAHGDVVVPLDDGAPRTLPALAGIAHPRGEPLFLLAPKHGPPA